MCVWNGALQNSATHLFFLLPLGKFQGKNKGLGRAQPAPTPYFFHSDSHYGNSGSADQVRGFPK
jgi:hypothetical protein